MKLNYIQLISSEPIELVGVGHIVPPSLKKIRSFGYIDGQSNYEGILTTLLITPKQYFEIMGQTDIYNCMSDKQKKDICMFDIWMSTNESREILKNSLCFFIAEKLIYNNELLAFDVVKRYKYEGAWHQKIIGHIDRNSYAEVIDVIKEVCYVNKSEFEDAKPKNKKAEEILAKLKKANKSKKRSVNKSMELGNLISALCVCHNSYNLNNIWSLTVYQLYDQFERQNIKNQIDINAMKWSAWGKEEFDYSLWYKSIKG